MSLGEWALTVLTGIAAGIIAGLLTAMGWFRSAKNRLYTKVENIESRLPTELEKVQSDFDRRYDKVELQLNSHTIQLTVLATSQANIDSKLEELKYEGREQNKKLDELLKARP